MREHLPLKIQDLERTLHGPQHHKLLGDTHGSDLLLQRGGGEMLAIDGIKVQGKFILQQEKGEGRWGSN